MAQNGYTPILIYASGTATNVPLAANMTSTSSGAELALNYADGKLYYKNSSGVVTLLVGTGGAGVVAGSNTQVQFNNSGVFGASANLTWDGTSFSATNYVATGSITSSSAKGVYSYGTLSYSDVNHILTMQSSQNSYIQMEVQNTNTGTAASSDVVVGNNNTTASTYYGDFGMNSSGWTGTPGTNSFGAPNMVYLTATTGDLLLGTTTANPIRFATNGGADAMYIDTSGNVGIGTSSPSYKLDVLGSTGIRYTSSTYQNGGFIAARDSSSGGTYQSYTFTEGATTTAYLRNYGSIYGAGLNYAIDLWNAQNSFIRFGTNNAEVMRIDSSGNLGIGTTTPTQLLDLVKSSAAATQMRFKNSVTTNGFIVGVSAAGDSLLYNGDATNLAMFTNAAERMRIDSSGRLSVGVSSSLNTAFVSVGGWNSGTYLGTVYQPSNSGAFTAIGFNNSAGTQQGYISCNGSGTTSYVTSSDYRLKDDIQPMTGGLDKVAKLKPVTYSWKSNGSAGQGFIAHELAEVVPDCVTGEKDAVDEEGKPIYQGIDTSFLVATLTAAIQEQQALITSLTTRLTALENK
jgi:hypothetical protein